MVRPSGPKTRCGGEWTESRFRSFVFSLLRQGTMRWAPKTRTQQKARISRGLYVCNECKEHVPNSIAVIDDKGKRKRVNNIFVDHLSPIVDPEVGFNGWDEYIERMFCEEDNLQLLCGKCHKEKSQLERQRKKNKNEDKQSL